MEKTIDKKAIRTEVAKMMPAIEAYMARNGRERKWWSKMDVERIIIAHELDGDYTEVFKSKLYKKYGGTYCSLLCAISLYQDGLIK